MRAPVRFSAAFLILCGGLVLLPGIDLWASGWFFRPGAGFFLGDWPPFRLVHDGLGYAVWAYVVALIAVLAIGTAGHRKLFGLDAKAAFYLFLALALGPGLTVNTIFKDHWGRARPVQITQFGGAAKFTPAFVPSDQCRRNCSFPAGDPAVGFYLVAAGLLVAKPRPRSAAIAGAVVLGSALGIVRMAQGGHFLSDVAASGFLVIGESWLLYRALIVDDGLARLGAALRRPSPSLQRFIWLTLAAVALFVICYARLDQPVAEFFHGFDPPIVAIFAAITHLGEGIVYELPLGLTLIVALTARRSAVAWRLGFVFAAIAIPGLIGDVMKPLFGRARPTMLFRDGTFGFSWGAAHANFWSFPSGHSITVVALTAALYAIEPLYWPAYALLAFLVMASRVVIDAHYLSDVVTGAYLGLVATWALAAALEHGGIALRLRGPARTP